MTDRKRPSRNGNCPQADSDASASASQVSAARTTRSLLRFLLIACVIYFGLLLMWPVFSNAYSRTFIATSHTLFHRLGSNVQVVFLRIEERDGRDVSMQVRNLRAGLMVERHLPTRYSGYLPAALLIALTVATPLSWRRRLVSLAIGMALLHIYIFLVLWLTIIRVLAREGPAQLYHLSSFWDQLLERVIHHTTASPTFSMLIPVIVWAAVTFRRGDLAHFTSENATN